MKTLCVLLCLLLLMLPMSADSPKAKVHAVSNIHVTVAGLGCTAAGTNMFQVLSWSRGASNPTTLGATGGISAGKVSVSSLNILKSLDGCSPALFGGVITSKHFGTVTLVETDKDNNILMTLTLTEAAIESWQMSGTASDDSPTESVSIAFVKACIEEPGSGAKFCYDASTNKAVRRTYDRPRAAAGIVLSAMPAAAWSCSEWLPIPRSSRRNKSE